MQQPSRPPAAQAEAARFVVGTSARIARTTPARGGVPIGAMVVLAMLVSRTEFMDGAPAAKPLPLDRRAALRNLQPLERGPNPLLTLLVQDRLVFEPQDEG